MGELGDLLEPLHAAPTRFATVRGVAHLWQHGTRLQELHRGRRTGRQQARLSLVIASSGELQGDAETSRMTVRFWVERPDRAREEIELDHPGGHTSTLLVS